MKKLFALVLTIFAVSLFAKTNKSLKNVSVVDLFKQKEYKYICDHRWHYINKYELKREDILSLVAYSCLKVHFLTPALDLAKVLRITKEGRINATYINTLYLMKLLLIQYLYNENALLDVKLPEISNDLLAHVFYLVQKQKPAVNKLKTSVTDGNKTYEIYFKPTINDIIIDIYQNGKKIKKEMYW